MEKPLAGLGSIFNVIKTSEDLLSRKQQAVDRIEQEIVAEKARVSAVQTEVEATSALLQSLHADLPGHQLQLQLQNRLACSLEGVQAKHQLQLKSCQDDLLSADAAAESAVSALEGLAVSVHNQLQLDGSRLLAGAAEKLSQLRTLQLEQAALSCELRLREDSVKDTVKARSCCLALLRQLLQLQHHQRQLQLHHRSKGQHQIQLADEIEQQAREVEEECECLQSVAAAVKYELDSKLNKQRSPEAQPTARCSQGQKDSLHEDLAVPTPAPLQQSANTNDSREKEEVSTKPPTTEQSGSAPCSKSQQEKESDSRNPAVVEGTVSSKEVTFSCQKTLDELGNIIEFDDTDEWWSNDEEIMSMERYRSTGSSLSPDWGESDLETLSICTNPSELASEQSHDMDEVTTGFGLTVTNQCSDVNGSVKNTTARTKSSVQGIDEVKLLPTEQAPANSNSQISMKNKETEKQNEARQFRSSVTSSTTFNPKMNTETNGISYSFRTHFATTKTTTGHKPLSSFQDAQHPNQKTNGSTRNFANSSNTQKNFTTVHPFISSVRPPLVDHNSRGTGPAPPPLRASQSKTVRFKFQRTSMIDLNSVRRPVPQKPILKSGPQYQSMNKATVNQCANSSQRVQDPFSNRCANRNIIHQTLNLRPTNCGMMSTPTQSLPRTGSCPGGSTGPGECRDMKPPRAPQAQIQPRNGLVSFNQGQKVAPFSSSSSNLQRPAAQIPGRFPRPWMPPTTAVCNVKSNPKNIQAHNEQNVSTESFQGSKPPQIRNFSFSQPSQTSLATQSSSVVNTREAIGSHVSNESTTNGNKRGRSFEMDSPLQAANSSIAKRNCVPLPNPVNLPLSGSITYQLRKPETLPLPQSHKPKTVPLSRPANLRLPGPVTRQLPGPATLPLPRPVTFTRDSEQDNNRGIVFAGSAAVNRAAMAAKKLQSSGP